MTTSPIQPLKDAAEQAGAAVRTSAERIGTMASENVVKPAKAAAERAGDAASEYYQEGKDAVCDGTKAAGTWISNNPFAAVALGVAAGLLLGSYTKFRS